MRRLYRRQGEVGTPYCVTVDVQTVGDRDSGESGDGRVTVRDRDSMEQIRVPISELTSILGELLAGSGGNGVGGCWREGSGMWWRRALVRAFLLAPRSAAEPARSPRPPFGTFRREAGLHL